MPRQASASLPVRGPVPRDRAESNVIRLTRGGLKNDYVSLAKYLDFFPAAAIGASKVQDGEGVPLTLHFAGLPEMVKTDIAGKHRFFRRRDPWRKFFAHHRLVEGDSVTIERLSHTNTASLRSRCGKIAVCVSPPALSDLIRPSSRA